MAQFSNGWNVRGQTKNLAGKHFLSAWYQGILLRKELNSRPVHTSTYWLGKLWNKVEEQCGNGILAKILEDK